MNSRATDAVIVREWRRAKGLPDDPLDASKQTGYVERMSRERAGRIGQAGYA